MHQRIYKHLPTILASLALIIALVGVPGVTAGGILVTSKQIRNGSVKSVDLRNGGVKAADVKNGSIGSADIGTDAVKSPEIATGAVESQALDLPGPVQCEVTGATKIHPTTSFAKVADVCTYNKATAESALEVNWSGSVEGHNGGEISGCVFQIRVNDQASPQGGGETFALGPAAVATSAIFPALGVGQVTVSIWARLALNEPTAPESDVCTLGPSAAPIKQTIVVGEQVV